MIESASTVRGNGVSAAGTSDAGRVRSGNEDRFFFDVARGLFLVVEASAGTPPARWRHRWRRR